MQLSRITPDNTPNQMHVTIRCMLLQFICLVSLVRVSLLALEELLHEGKRRLTVYIQDRS